MTPKFRPRPAAPRLALLAALMAAALAPLPAGANLQDKLTTSNAEKIQKYIDKAFAKLDEADRPARMEMLIARLHVCALVNKLFMENTTGPDRRRNVYRIRYDTFTKLIAAMSETAPRGRSEQLAAEARDYTKRKLESGDSAGLQIVFNSCLDIRTGKITHALSNMKRRADAETTAETEGK